jgi:hypothetical protein
MPDLGKRPPAGPAPRFSLGYAMYQGSGQATPCSQSQIRQDRYLGKHEAAQVESIVALSVVVRWIPLMPAAYGTQVARPPRMRRIPSETSGSQGRVADPCGAPVLRDQGPVAGVAWQGRCGGAVQGKRQSIRIASRTPNNHRHTVVSVT